MKKITINLKNILSQKKMSQIELAKILGISDVKLSRIVNGVSIKFDMLAKICEALNVEPGDILEVKEVMDQKTHKKMIPFFLDYSGTTDKLLSGGVQNVVNFFEVIKDFEKKTNHKICIIMVTGSALDSAKAKFKLLSQLAENYGMPNLFYGTVSEYCGFLSTKNETITLLPFNVKLADIREQIESIIKAFDGKINPKTNSYFNICFENITRIELAKICESIDNMLIKNGLDREFETISYYDEYGIEIDLKPKLHTKSLAVESCVKKLKETIDVKAIIIGGDNQEEDLKMYTENKDNFDAQDIQTVFVAPASIGSVKTEDRNIIIGNWTNVDGIIDALSSLNKRVQVNQDGGLTL